MRLANIIAGCNSIQGGKFLEWARSSTDLERDRGRSAFLMGALCHILEVDDLHRASVVHPGCVVIPAVFALAAGKTGAAALRAVLHGFEATCRVGMAVGPRHYKIWHNTATCGPFGSVVAAGRLLDLDDAGLVNAIGNAGSQSAGLWEFIETGAETKHLHAGRAAESGVVAAQLAAAGLSGAPQILEGDRGFFKATCPDGDPSLILANPKSPWQVHATSIKPWPSCRHTHPAIECALQLFKHLADHRIDQTNIARIEVHTYQAALNLCDRAQPDSVYAAKFSLQHCVGAATTDGVVNFNSFEPDARQRLSELAQKIVCIADVQIEQSYPQHWGTKIAVVMNDGSEIEFQTQDAKGDPEAPLTQIQMIDKARELMVFGELKNSDQLINSILSMEKDGNVPNLIEIILSL